MWLKKVHGPSNVHFSTVKFKSSKIPYINTSSNTHGIWNHRLHKWREESGWRAAIIATRDVHPLKTFMEYNHSAYGRKPKVMDWHDPLYVCGQFHKPERLFIFFFVLCFLLGLQKNGLFFLLVPLQGPNRIHPHLEQLWTHASTYRAAPPKHGQPRGWQAARADRANWPKPPSHGRGHRRGRESHTLHARRLSVTPRHLHNQSVRPSVRGGFLAKLDKVLVSPGVPCTKHVRVYVSAQKGYEFEHCRITYTYN